ncbi:hypothetical protein GGTG_06193 [Gaeumannomyces tritici R3-111a-1]|uniref:Uncharacterized protein n=1 Tax=Gaeumannomyces tritici (strain R3-111a-1) TaxID=644352 RepID=J3NY39_GAET3|nr:hypothetical protein GGTG_06193 [Gaeumannomyces tritici R3-111a-1]EJT76272.1 hypothetical protein GGTG_06193 [Gaeumannomyces tritici R3-111a-1]
MVSGDPSGTNTRMKGGKRARIRQGAPGPESRWGDAPLCWLYDWLAPPAAIAWWGSRPPPAAQCAGHQLNPTLAPEMQVGGLRAYRTQGPFEAGQRGAGGEWETGLKASTTPSNGKSDISLSGYCYRLHVDFHAIVLIPPFTFVSDRIKDGRYARAAMGPSQGLELYSAFLATAALHKQPFTRCASPRDQNFPGTSRTLRWIEWPCLVP